MRLGEEMTQKPWFKPMLACIVLIALIFAYVWFKDDAIGPGTFDGTVTDITDEEIRVAVGLLGEEYENDLPQGVVTVVLQKPTKEKTSGFTGKLSRGAVVKVHYDKLRLANQMEGVVKGDWKLDNPAGVGEKSGK